MHPKVSSTELRASDHKHDAMSPVILLLRLHPLFSSRHNHQSEAPLRFKDSYADICSNVSRSSHLSQQIFTTVLSLKARRQGGAQSIATTVLYVY